jgi:hypothetical protein
VVRTTEWIAANYRNGSDGAETIRNFVKDAYAMWGIKYLLLGGDSQQVPVRLAYSSFYPCRAAQQPGRYVLRLPRRRLECRPRRRVRRVQQRRRGFVVRSVRGTSADALQRRSEHDGQQDQELRAPQHTGFTRKVLFLAEVLTPADYKPGDPIGLNGGDLAEYIRLSDMTSAGLTVARNYQTNSLYVGSQPETRQAAIDSLNAGYNHVVHIGHGFRFNMSVGDASVVNADADALTNGVKLANMNLLNCTSCAFTYECLAEHFLRNPNGGAVSVVGSNDSAFPWW